MRCKGKPLSCRIPAVFELGRDINRARNLRLVSQKSTYFHHITQHICFIVAGLGLYHTLENGRKY